MNNYIIQPTVKNKEYVDFILKVSEITKQDAEYLNSLFYYNIVTPDQISELLNRSRSFIFYACTERKTVKSGIKKPLLQTVKPFRTTSTPGPIFLVVNSHLFSYIIEKLQTKKRVVKKRDNKGRFSPRKKPVNK